LPSKANFLLVRHPGHGAGNLSASLRERGVIVRHFGKPERIAAYLRISVGTEAQCALLLDALREILE